MLNNIFNTVSLDGKIKFAINYLFLLPITKIM